MRYKDNNTTTTKIQTITTFLLFLSLLSSSLLLVLTPYAHAQSSSSTTAVTININSTVFSPGSMLVAYGKVIPNDSLIIELINPMNRIVHRTQVDVDSRGVFSSVILTFPNPNDQFIEGTYTLVITSSIQGSVYSKAIVFQASNTEIRVQQGDMLQQQQQQQITRRLDIQLNAPSIIGIDERVSIVARVTMDNTLFNVNASDIKARIIMPDASVRELSFNAIDDGIYATELTLSMVGLHVVTASIEYNGLKASSMASINVTDAPVLNMGSTLSQLSKSIDNLNSSIEGLRNDINTNNARLSLSLERINSSISQMLALLLPIIGMITIIVALQATILARRGGSIKKEEVDRTNDKSSLLGGSELCSL